jgi:hypothetical protein
VYVGDGATQGGTVVGGTLELESSPTLSADLNLNGNNIIGSGNINIDGNITATGNISIGDGVEDNVIVGGTISSSLIPTNDSAFDLGSTAFRWQNGHFTGLFVDGEISVNNISLNNILAADSTVLYDALTQTFEGNLRGSVIAEDSSVIIDGGSGNAILTNVDVVELIANSVSVSGEVTANSISVTDTLFTEVLNVASVQTSLAVVPIGEDTDSNRITVTSRDNNSAIVLTRSSETDISGTNDLYGSIFFERNDINGPAATSIINARTDRLLFAVDTTSDFTNTENYIIFRDPGLLGIGKIPDAKLDVEGDIVASGFVQFGSYTTSERDELTPVNGMVLYNTTVDKFQGYAGGSWVDLH